MVKFTKFSLIVIVQIFGITSTVLDLKGTIALYSTDGVDEVTFTLIRTNYTLKHASTFTIETRWKFR